VFLTSVALSSRFLKWTILLVRKWPGFSENLRVLDWIIRRCKGEVGAVNSAIGLLPRQADLNLAGIDLSPGAIQTLLEVDRKAWGGELTEIQKYFDSFSGRIPPALVKECQRVAATVNEH
jgi:phosphoenolpyruvate carboxykinase (GTP)